VRSKFFCYWLRLQNVKAGAIIFAPEEKFGSSFFRLHHFDAGPAVGARNFSGKPHPLDGRFGDLCAENKPLW